MYGYNFSANPFFYGRTSHFEKNTLIPSCGNFFFRLSTIVLIFFALAKSE